MRLSAVWQLARSELRSGTARFVLLAVLAAAGLSAYAFLEGSEARSLAAMLDHERTAGGRGVRAVLERQVDGPACAGLEQTSNVESAVAIRKRGEIRFANLPAIGYDVLEATPGLLGQVHVTGDALGSTGVLLGRGLAERVGAAPGATLMTDHGALLVAGVTEVAWNDPLDAAVISLVPPGGRFDTCQVVMRSSRNDGLALLDLAAPSGRAEVSVLNPDFGTAPDYVALLRQRSTRLMQLLPALLMFCAAFGVTARRGLALSAEAHLGVRRTDILLRLALEVVAAVAAGVVLASPVLIWGWRETPIASFSGWLIGQGATATAWTFLGGLAGLLLASPLVSSRRMLRAFQHR